jgi:hypothetical protein
VIAARTNLLRPGTVTATVQAATPETATWRTGGVAAKAATAKTFSTEEDP